MVVGSSGWLIDRFGDGMAAALIRTTHSDCFVMDDGWEGVRCLCLELPC